MWVILTAWIRVSEKCSHGPTLLDLRKWTWTKLPHWFSSTALRLREMAPLFHIYENERCEMLHFRIYGRKISSTLSSLFTPFKWVERCNGMLQFGRNNLRAFERRWRKVARKQCDWGMQFLARLCTLTKEVCVLIFCQIVCAFDFHIKLLKFHGLHPRLISYIIKSLVGLVV